MAKEEKKDLFIGELSVISGVRLSSKDLNEVYVKSVLKKAKKKKSKKQHNGFDFAAFAKVK